MQYGICNLSTISVRIEPNNKSEMLSQILFGEHFKVLEMRSAWSKIRLAFDNFEGWIDNKQFVEISKETYQNLDSSIKHYSSELVDFVTNTSNQQLITIPLGASLPSYKNNICKIIDKEYHYDGTSITNENTNKKNIINTSFLYLNTPYLWGGKTPFGIDCSGFTQMVYKLCGIQLFRNASEQATQGEVLSFIEESEPGDLAFFDDKEGNIIHVGIIMKDNYIIHAHGKVRIDRLDHSGIYNAETKRHTHKLRVIKKIV